MNVVGMFLVMSIASAGVLGGDTARFASVEERLMERATTLLIPRVESQNTDLGGCYRVSGEGGPSARSQTCGNSDPSERGSKALSGDIK